jgi:hypothetical protein
MPLTPVPRRLVPGVVLRALIINDARDLDLRLWLAAVEARDSVGLGI